MYRYYAVGIPAGALNHEDHRYLYAAGNILGIKSITYRIWSYFLGGNTSENIISNPDFSIYNDPEGLRSIIEEMSNAGGDLSIVGLHLVKTGPAAAPSVCLAELHGLTASRLVCIKLYLHGSRTKLILIIRIIPALLCANFNGSSLVTVSHRESILRIPCDIAAVASYAQL